MPTDDAIDRVCPNCQTTVHAVGRAPVRCPQCQTLIPSVAGKHEDLPSLADLEHSADAPEGTVKAPVPQASQAPPASSPLPAAAVDLSGHDDVYGVVCRICDTRIHVRPEQIGQEIECPICFSPVLVTAKVDKKKNWGRGGATHLEPAPRDTTSGASEDSDELRLADLDDAPPKPSTAVPPKPSASDSSDDDLPRLQPLEDDAIPAVKPPPLTHRSPAVNDAETSAHPPADPDSGAPARPAETKTEKSRREKLAAAELRRQQAEADQGFGRPAGSELASEFPKFELGPLATAIRKMVLTPGVLVRAMTCLALMAVGVVIAEWAHPYGMDDSDLEIMDWAVGRLLAGVGLGIYLLGLFGLWLVCGTLFRDAASGLAQIRSWKIQGSSEILGTWLLFAFSMFIAGLPALFLLPLVIPLRILVGPLFLLSAWFNRSAWSIISVDVFRGSRKMSKQWNVLYTCLTILAALGLLAGGLLWMRVFTEITMIDMLLSVMGVTLHGILTLIFAPLVGWHCGLVMEHLENE